jgi:hypothetical protein
VNLTAAIYNRLASDSILVGWLADYQGSPAIFTDDRLPGSEGGDAPEFPYVWSHGEVANEPWDTKTSLGRSPTRDIVAYHEHRATVEVEQIAERIYRLFHRHRLPVGGHRTVTARASGPIRISSDDYDARIVTVRFRLSETEEGS